MLWGGGDGDTLTGGADNDQFVITGSGDIVSDFVSGADKLVLIGFGNSFDGMAITQVGADAQISFGNNSVLLEGVTAAALTAADFQFESLGVTWF